MSGDRSMTPERWKRMEELDRAADALPTGEHAAFLATACPDDETVRGDVAALLQAPLADGGFLAQPGKAATRDARRTFT